MKNNNIKIFQNEILKIAKEIAKICEKHQIKYSIGGGTLLGAIRHKGFIPWDDDLDISMPREDYERFLKIASKELPDPYILQEMNQDKNYGLLFAKVRNKNTVAYEEYSKNVKTNNGIWVDIFPYDYVSDDINVAKKEFKQVKFLNSLLTIKLGYKYQFKKLYQVISYYIIRFITLFISTKFLKKQINRKMQKHNHQKCKNMIVYGCQYSFEKEIKSTKLFNKLVKYKFEDTEFYGFESYDQYLTEFYGDYMKLPPKDKRITHITKFEIKK